MTVSSDKPKQRRSLESQKKILDAAETLFAAKGYRETKVGDIIKASGCSVGSFYHQFKDKRGVFEVLYDRYVRYIDDVIGNLSFDHSAEPELEGVFRRLARTALQVLESHKGARRAAEELSLVEPTVGENGFTLTEKLIDQVNRDLEQYEDQINHPQPKQAVARAVQLQLVILTQQTLRPRAGFPEDADALIEMLTDAACGVLRVGLKH